MLRLVARIPVIQVALLGLIVCDLAYGEEQQRVLESTRFMARGNTFVAATDSNEATRGNPATLAEAKMNFQLRLMQLDVFVGKNTIDSVGDIATIDAKASAVALLETFRDKFGKRQYGRVQLMPLATRVFAFEISPFVATTNFIDMRLPSIPEVEFSSHTLAGLNLAYAHSFGKNWMAGVNIRPAHQQRFYGQVAFADLIEFVDSDSVELSDMFSRQEGLVVGLDLGVIWQTTKNLRLGFVGENLGQAANNGEFLHPTPPLAQRLGFGLDYRLDFKPWYWDWLIEVQNIDQAASGQLDPFRTLHLGTELGLSYLSRDTDFGLQFGINEGYGTGGFYLDLFFSRLNFAYYAVELGEYAGQRKDRRWGVTLESAMTF